jgi:hypothetical protein
VEGFFRAGIGTPMAIPSERIARRALILSHSQSRHRMSSLGTELPKEMTRVRDELLPLYDSIPTGKFAATMMRADLDLAQRALAEGDVIAMIRVYESLKAYKA